MQTSEMIDKVTRLLAAEPHVKFAYLFGSVARQAAGPLSDIDFAVYLDARINLFKKRLALMEAIAKEIRTERFDLVILNGAPVVLQFEVIKSGIVLKEDRPRRVVFETDVVRKYLDTAHMREVQYQYLKEALSRRGANG